jgi:hypothetical protein
MWIFKEYRIINLRGSPTYLRPVMGTLGIKLKEETKRRTTLLVWKVEMLSDAITAPAHSKCESRQFIPCVGLHNLPKIAYVCD